MEMEGLINVKSYVQRKIKLFAGVFNQQNKTKEEREQFSQRATFFGFEQCDNISSVDIPTESFLRKRAKQNANTK